MRCWNALSAACCAVESFSCASHCSSAAFTATEVVEALGEVSDEEATGAAASDASTVSAVDGDDEEDMEEPTQQHLNSSTTTANQPRQGVGCDVGDALVDIQWWWMVGYIN